MPKECHRIIIDELVELNFRGGVQYYINNEPLMDNRLIDFIRDLKSKKLDLTFINIQINGNLLTFEKGVAFFENGLDWLVVNDYSSYKKPSKRLIRIIEQLHKRFPEKRIDFSLRNSHEAIANRAGLAPNKPMNIHIRAPCTYPFR